MKKLNSILIFLLLIASVAAQTDAASEDVGITPDSRFYGLENAFKKISLAFTFNKEAKARKELEISKERLREVKLMIERNNVDAAEKAEKKHKEIIERLKLRLETDADEEELETQVEIETEINDQETEIEDIKTRVEIKGELTPEQRELLNKLIESLKGNNRELKIKIDAREERLKIKLEEKGLDKEEIKARFEERKNNGLERALKERIENVEKQIEISKERFGDKEDLNLARQRLEEAKKLIENNELESAKNLILEALKLTISVRANVDSEAKEKIKEEIKEIRKERLEKVERVLREKKEETKEEIEKVREIEDSDDDSDEETETEESSGIKRNSGDDSGY